MIYSIKNNKNNDNNDENDDDNHLILSKTQADMSIIKIING